MKIFGVALLAACYLAGQLLGALLGRLLQVEGNVGGVGFAMLALILLTDWMKRRGFLEAEPERGILFWSAMYIPVVVAMSATLDVRAALSGGWVAVIAGLGGTLLCFGLIPLIARLGAGGSINGESGKREDVV